MNAWAVVALGSNLPFGPLAPAEVLQAAMGDLAQLPGVAQSQTSRVWSTEPVMAEGSVFSNAVALLHFLPEHRLDAEELLGQLMQLEARYGRRRIPSSGPSNGVALPSSAHALSPARSLDLDLIMASVGPHRSATLTLPHPRAHERAFVLGPLSEIAPDLPILLPDGRQTTVAVCFADLEGSHAC